MRTGLLLCWLLIHSVAYSQNGGVISGEIRGMDGKPARDIRVAVAGVMELPEGPTPASQPDRIGSTDNAGRYRLENVPDGRYFLIAGRIDTPSLFPGTSNSRDARILTIVSGVALEQMNFQLVQPEGMIVSGRVVPDGMKTPRTITLFAPPGPGWFRENVPVMEDGTFRFRGVPPNTYSLSVYPNGYLWNNSVVVKEKSVTGVRVVASSFAQPQGEVELDGNGPLPRFELTLRGKLGKTTAGIGRLQDEGRPLTTLPVGEYHVSVEGLPKEYRVESFTYGSTNLLKRNINIVGGLSTFRLKLAIAQPSRLRHVRGKVRGVENLRTTSQVSLYGPSLLEAKNVQLNPDGSFEFSDVASGTYTLTVGHSEPKTVVVGDADIDGEDIDVPAVRQVRGRVLMDDGGPLPRFDMSFSKVARTYAYAASAAPGTFEASLVEGESTIQVYGFPSDVYRIRSITFGDADLLKEPLRISGPDLPEIIVTLGRIAPVFRVAGRASSSLPQAAYRDPKVVLWGPAGTLETTAASDGSFAIEGVPPGTYRASFPWSNGTIVTVVDRDVSGVSIPPASQTTTTITPPSLSLPQETRNAKGTRIRGRIKAPGRLLPSRLLFSDGEQNLEAVVEADGRFEFRATPGNYNVSTEHHLEVLPNRIIVGNRSLDSVELAILERREVHGRIVVIGDSPMPRAALRLVPVGVSSLRWVPEVVTVRPNGTFRMTPMDGDYRVEMLSLAAPYRIQSIRHGTQDLLREKLKVSKESSPEIVVTLELIPSMTWIRAEGRVAGVERLPPLAKVVLLESSSRFFLESPIDENGRFVLPKVPPGTYTMRIDPPAFGVAQKSVSLKQDASGLELVIPEQQQLNVRIRVDEGRRPGFSFNIKSSDGRGFQYSLVPGLTVPMALGRLDIECISDVCGRALGRLLNEPLVLDENSAPDFFAFKLPEGEYRLAIEHVGPGYVLKSMTQGTKDLLTEPLKLTGGDSPEVVVTFGRAP